MIEKKHMLFIVPALGAALAYGIDVVVGKVAVDAMPMHTFTFIISIVYALVGLSLLTVNWRHYLSFFGDRKNRRPIAFAIVAIVFGTVLADALAWWAIKIAHVSQGAVVSTLVHSAPFFALLALVAVYRHRLTVKTLIGMGMAVGGCAVLVWDNKLH